MKSNKRRVLFKQAPAADANAQEPPEADYVMTLLDLDDDLSLSDSSDGNEDQDLDLLPDDDRNRELDGQQPTKKLSQLHQDQDHQRQLLHHLSAR